MRLLYVFKSIKIFTICRKIIVFIHQESRPINRIFFADISRFFKIYLEKKTPTFVRRHVDHTF